MKPTALIAILSLGAISASSAVEIEVQQAEAEPQVEVQIEAVEWLDKGRHKPQTEAIPKMYAAEKKVAMKMEALIRNKGYYQLKFRIINPTDKPISFTGYSEASPLTRTQHWKDGKWVDPKPLGICGTGLRQCTIAPGQSAVFQTSIAGDQLPGRIGFNYSHGEKNQGHQLWSEKIER